MTSLEWVPLVEGAKMVQVGHLLFTVQDLIGASPNMYIIEPTLIHIVVHKILNKSGRATKIAHYKPTTCTSLARHRSTLK